MLQVGSGSVEKSTGFHVKMHIIYPCINRISVLPEAQDEEPDEEDQEVDREDEVLHAGEAALVPHFHPFRGFSLVGRFSRCAKFTFFSLTT